MPLAAIAGSSQSGMVSAEDGGSPPDSTGARRAAARLGDGRPAEPRRVVWAGGRARRVPVVVAPTGCPGVRGSGAPGCSATRGSTARCPTARGPAALGSAVRGSTLRGSTVRGSTAGAAPGGSAGPGDSGSVGMLLLPLPWRTAPTVRTGRMAV
ncbi:hypothetical protein GCM10010519_44180 [Streptomyces lactacystinicus]